MSVTLEDARHFEGERIGFSTYQSDGKLHHRHGVVVQVSQDADTGHIDFCVRPEPHCRLCDAAMIVIPIGARQSEQEETE